MSTTPLYHQIKKDILQQIENHQLHPGDKLPTEQKLAEFYFVSRITISKALNELKEEGVLISYPGKGTFVHTPDPLLYGQTTSSPALYREMPHHTNMKEIACIFPNITDMFALSMLNGIESAFPADSYICHIFQSKTSFTENQLLKYCLESSISGIALFSLKQNFLGDDLHPLYQKNFPIVLVDHPISGLPSSYVIGDHKAAGALCVSHLNELGHKRIAFVTTLSRDVTSIGLRITGAEEKASQLNMSHSPIRIIEHLDINKKAVYYAEYFKKLIFENKITAFIASDSLCCNYLYHLFNFMKLAIPNDVSLLSFDNPQTNIPGMNYFTYINQSEFTIGREAGNILRRKMEQMDTACYQKIIPPKLVVNRSTGSLR